METRDEGKLGPCYKRRKAARMVGVYGLDRADEDLGWSVKERLKLAGFGVAWLVVLGAIFAAAWEWVK
jgi:hypothetical protein